MIIDYFKFVRIGISICFFYYNILFYRDDVIKKNFKGKLDV